MSDIYAQAYATLELNLTLEDYEGAGYNCLECEQAYAIVEIHVVDDLQVVWGTGKAFRCCEDCAIELFAALGESFEDVWLSRKARSI